MKKLYAKAGALMLAALLPLTVMAAAKEDNQAGNKPNTTSQDPNGKPIARGGGGGGHAGGGGRGFGGEGAREGNRGEYNRDGYRHDGYGDWGGYGGYGGEFIPDDYVPQDYNIDPGETEAFDVYEANQHPEP